MGGRPDAGPYLLACLFRFPDFLAMIAIAGLSPARDGGKRAGRLTAAAARFAEHPALAIRNLSGLFRINAAIGGCFVSGSGIIDFRRGRRNRCRRGLFALAVADDGGSGT
jgi:hypothetical protein